MFPLTHVLLVCLITLGMASFVAAKFSAEGDTERFNPDSVLATLEDDLETTPDSLVSRAEGRAGEANTITLPLDIDAQALADDATDQALERALAVVDQPTQQLITHIEEVASGDNLFNIFKRVGFSPQVLHNVMSSGPLASRLKQIFPGHRLTFMTTPENELVRLVYSPGPLEALQFDKVGSGFEAKAVHRQPERLATYATGVIENSLFMASQSAGLDDDLTMRLAQIFQWDVDFVLDIRKGDEFHVLFEELYLGNEFIGYGNILAAEFRNQNRVYQAALYENAQGERHYFDPTGNSMRKAFLRAPVSFSRISSNFNMRRKHPLFKTNRPHRGIDYAAPQGTPVMASGDGRIRTASRTKPNGNFIVLQHGEQFVTKYLHLSRFARGIRSGSRVTQGQVIGYVGRTGYATGPHLHYEFLVNGTHRNPRTVKLPDAKPVPDAERDRFSAQTKPHLAMLQSHKEQEQLAAAR